MGEISVWHKGQPKQIGGVSHRTTAAALVGFVLSEGLWSVPTEQARRSGRCYALFENWRGCQRLIPPWKRIYKLWKLWGLERIHVKFFVKKVAMETLIRKDFEEYVEVSQLKVPKRHVALRMEPHAVGEEPADNSDSASSLYDDTGLFVVDAVGGESSLGTRRKRSLVNRVVRQNEHLRDISRTVEDVEEEILFYEAKLHHCRVVKGGKDYVQEAYLAGGQELDSVTPTEGGQQPLSPRSRDANGGITKADHSSDTGVPRAKTYVNPGVPHEGGDVVGSCDQTSGNSAIKTRPRTESNKKTGAKIVLVNPLPRSIEPNGGEVGKTVTEKNTAEIAGTSQSEDDIEKTIRQTQEISRLSDSEKLSFGPTDRNSLHAQKRHDRYGGRVKKRGSGLCEFEQSFEWIKVMDKEMKRLESIENLSFVDWDSESLLSDKDLTFYGGRKYKFRPALSGKSGKSRTISRSWETDSPRRGKRLSESELASDVLQGKPNLPDKLGSSRVSLVDTGSVGGYANKECATIDPVARTDAKRLPKVPDPCDLTSVASKRINATFGSSTICKSMNTSSKRPLFPFRKKIVDNMGKNAATTSASQDTMVSPSRSIGTTTGELMNGEIPTQLRSRTHNDKPITSSKDDDALISGQSVDESKYCNSITDQRLSSLDTCTTGNPRWQLPDLEVVGVDVPIPEANANVRKDAEVSRDTNVHHETKATICRVPKTPKRVSFLMDRISKPDSREIITRAPQNRCYPDGDSHVTGAIPRYSSPESKPIPVPRHVGRRSTSETVPVHPRRSTSPHGVKADAPNSHLELNEPVENGVSNSAKSVNPAPQSSPGTVRRVPKPPVYFSTEDSSPIRYHGTSCSVAKEPSKVTKSQQCTKENGVTFRVQPCFTPVHPRVEKLRSLHPKGSYSLTPADYTKISTRAESCLQNIIQPPPHSNIVGVVTCPVKERILKEEQKCFVLPAICPPPIMTPVAFSETVTTNKDVSPSPPRVRSPDQGLGSDIVSPRRESEALGKDSGSDGQELVSPREDTKASENDSGSDAGMGSVHSQDSGIGHASVVIETWV